MCPTNRQKNEILTISKNLKIEGFARNQILIQNYSLTDPIQLKKK